MRITYPEQNVLSGTCITVGVHKENDWAKQGVACTQHQG